MRRLSRRALHLLVLLVLAACGSGYEGGGGGPTEKNRFAVVCADTTATPAVRKTIDAILKSLGTTDCSAAEQILLTAKDLRLAWSSLSDLSPLSFATGVKWLYLDGNGLLEAQALALVPDTVTALYLDDNHLVDLGPLKRFTELKHLSLGNNHIADLAPLAALTKLQSLRLDGNVVTGVGVLSQLKDLKSLTLAGNLISDATALASLAQLESLDLDGNPVTALPTLDPTGKLEILSLRNTAVTTVAPLAPLANLEALDASGSPIPKTEVACPKSGATKAFCTQWLAP